jgi:hypothetical protein
VGYTDGISSGGEGDVEGESKKEGEEQCTRIDERHFFEDNEEVSKYYNKYLPSCKLLGGTNKQGLVMPSLVLYTNNVIIIFYKCVFRHVSICGKIKQFCRWIPPFLGFSAKHRLKMEIFQNNSFDLHVLCSGEGATST